MGTGEVTGPQHSSRSFQDLIPDNQCWGCGPHNGHGLRIKSYWAGDEAVCAFQPSPWHMAGPPTILNGGIIATIFDCHCVCTAIAGMYRAEGREMDEEPLIWCATVSLQVEYLRPTPIAAPVELRARIEELTAKKGIIACTLVSEGEERARARAVAVRVSDAWRRHGA